MALNRPHLPCKDCGCQAEAHTRCPHGCERFKFDAFQSEGLGCQHCYFEQPVTFVSSKSGQIALGFECTLRFTGWTAEQLEQRMSDFADHETRRIVAGNLAQLATE